MTTRHQVEQILTADNVVYTSKIIKAGALIGDTKTLLMNWDETLSVDTNLKTAQESNILGKVSRTRVADILSIFRQRYLTEESVLIALVTLVKAGFATEGLNRILYFHTARSNSLLHDFVINWLSSRYQLGRPEININDVKIWIDQQIQQGKTQEQWSTSTITRAARSLLSTLRDFGILQGAAKKRLTPIYIPVEAFAYTAFYLQLLQPSGEKLLYNPEWELFFLPTQAVERLFLEAHQYRLLEYQAAGSVIRLSFPTDSLEEYAHFIAQRQH